MLDEVQAVYILIGLLLGENRWLVEAAETIDKLLECLLVTLAVACVAGFGQLLRGCHFVDEIAYILVKRRQGDGVRLDSTVVNSRVLDFDLGDLLTGEVGRARVQSRCRVLLSLREHCL